MKKTYRLKNLDCANCARKMEDEIKKLQGINAASVSFLTQRISLDLSESADISKLEKAIVKICKKIESDCEVIL